jgi:hypothetical protein
MPQHSGMHRKTAQRHVSPSNDSFSPVLRFGQSLEQLSTGEQRSRCIEGLLL